MGQKYMRLLISFFIIWNILAIIFTNQGLRVNWTAQRLFLPYAKLTRIMQRWSLFAPEPRKYMKKYHFEITFADRTVQSWERPDPTNWNYFERQHAYNWQKFDLAGQNMENPILRNDIGAWVTRRFWNETNPPVKVVLYCDMANVPPFRDGQPVQVDKTDFVYYHQIIFTYEPIN